MKIMKKLCAVILAVTLAFQPCNVYAANGRSIKEFFSNLHDLVVSIFKKPPDEEYSLLNEVLSRVDEDYDPGKEKEKEVNNEVNKVLFIGDSRTCGLQDVSTDSSDEWVCQVSMGYQWMVNTAFPSSENRIGPNMAVVIALGVNDIYNKNNYINAINSKAEEWEEKGAKVYYAAVGPVQNNPYVTNQEIVAFNIALDANLTYVDFIDVYGFLENSGYNTVDGTHYDTTTSKKIYDYLKDKVKKGSSGSSSTGNLVWWNDTNRESSYLAYSLTNWAKFDGLYATLLTTPEITAMLDDELKKKEDQLDAAADKYGFSAYRALFKAIAQYRHVSGDPDIFRIADTGLNPYATNPSEAETGGTDGTDGSGDLDDILDDILNGGDGTGGDQNKEEDNGLHANNGSTKKISTKESIDIAAKLFSSCLSVAGYPDPSKVDDLKALLQAFEFEGTGFITYCQNKYSQAKAEQFASNVCNGRLRTNSEDIRTYGKYAFRDQRFPDKVLKYYSVISIGNANIPEDEQKLLMDAMASWPAGLDPRRKQMIEKGLSLYGKVTYSMGQRLQPNPENPQFLDCSSFVGWSYYFSGLTDVSYYWCTGNFLFDGRFRQIQKGDMRPGDIGLKNWVGAGGSNHVGIYLGKSSSGQDVWLHCTSGNYKRIVINNYGGFAVFMRYNGFHE